MKVNMSMDYHSELPMEGFVPLPVVLRVLSIGKTSWWNGIRMGKYPRPSKFGSKTSRWHVDDIRALIAKYKAAAGNDTQSTLNAKEE